MDQKLIDSYLFNEMSEMEREQFEDKFIGDEVAFVDIAERENELVDRYAKGDLAPDVARRFEASMEAHPARRQKIANGQVLRELIADARPHQGTTITIAERSGIFAWLADLFTFRSRAFQFASVGLILLLTLASIFLFVENRRLGSLESELAAARQRETELSTEIRNAKDAAGELTTDVNAERERIQKLEEEIAELRDKGRTNSGPEVPESPTIATLILSPVLRRGEPMKRLDISPSVNQLSVVVILAHDLLHQQTVIVKFNDGFSVTASIMKDRITASVPRRFLKQGQNSVEIRTGYDPIAKHDFYINFTE